jgi:hypothetical protein
LLNVNLKNNFIIEHTTETKIILLVPLDHRIIFPGSLGQSENHGFSLQVFNPTNITKVCTNAQYIFFTNFWSPKDAMDCAYVERTSLMASGSKPLLR